MPYTARVAVRALLRAAPLAALAACAIPVRPAGSTPPTPELRVLVYNIHAGKDAAGAGNLERVARLVRERGVDIALLQEVDSLTTRSGGVDQVETLRSATGLHGVFGRTLDYQGGGYGIAVLSRFPIASRRLVPLPVVPEQERAGGSREPRGALVVSLRLPDGELHLVNTHLDASGEDGYRLQEARHVRSIADSLRRDGAPVLVGGDLNAPPSSPVVVGLAEAGLRDGWLACGGAGEGLTYPAAAPVKRIDYLFLTPGIRCLSAEVVGDETSDHRAVLFRIGT